MEGNPARSRWRLVRRRIFDGSFFLFAQDVSLENQKVVESGEPVSPFQPLKQARMRQSVSFNQIVSNANDMVNRLNHGRSIESFLQSKPSSELPGNLPEKSPRRLADMHTTRAARSENPKSSYTEHLDRKAANRMTNFISENVRALRRLSRIPLDIDPVGMQHAISVYGSSNHRGGSNHDHSGGGCGGSGRRMARQLTPGEDISNRISSRDRSNRSVNMDSLETRSSSVRPSHKRAESVTPRFSPAHERSSSVASTSRLHRKLSISSIKSQSNDPMSRGLEELKNRFVST